MLKQSRFFFHYSIALCIITCFCLLFSSCNFQLRSNKHFPIQVKRLYFESDTPYSPLSTQLHASLSASGIQLVTQKNQAKFSLMLSKDFFSDSSPSVLNTSLPSTINFSHTATVTLQNNRRNKIVASKTFHVSRSLTLNVNQIYTKNIHANIKKTLTRQLVLLIRYWLAQQTKRLHHATTPKTT